MGKGIAGDSEREKRLFMDAFSPKFLPYYF